MRFEGGFQGRCNKLVDGCYSFWQAGLLPLLHRALFKEGRVSLSQSSRLLWISSSWFLTLNLPSYNLRARWLTSSVSFILCFLSIFFIEQESLSWVSSDGCSSSRPCRSTSSCAVRTQQGACWISLASQSHTIWTHTHTLSGPMPLTRFSTLCFVLSSDPEISTTRVTAWADSL